MNILKNPEYSRKRWSYLFKVLSRKESGWKEKINISTWAKSGKKLEASVCNVEGWILFSIMMTFRDSEILE